MHFWICYICSYAITGMCRRTVHALGSIVPRGKISISGSCALLIIQFELIYVTVVYAAYLPILVLYCVWLTMTTEKASPQSYVTVPFQQV